MKNIMLLSDASLTEIKGNGNDFSQVLGLIGAIAGGTLNLLAHGIPAQMSVTYINVVQRTNHHRSYSRSTQLAITIV